MLRGVRTCASKRLARSFASGHFPDVSAYPAARVSTLKNGIRVVTEAYPGETSSVGVHVEAGSRFETAENNGVSHFLEHLMFKGSNDAQLNTFTSRESTVLSTNGLASETAKNLDSIAELLQTDISQDAIDAERGNILSSMPERSLEDAVFDRLHETAYRGHPLGRSPLGLAENIESLNKTDLDAFVKAHYTGRRIVVSAAGNVDHAAVVKQAEAAFGSIAQDAPEDVPAPQKQPAHFTGSDIRIRYDSAPELHVAFGFPTAGASDADTVPLMLCQELIGAWTRSTAFGAGHHHENPLISKMSTDWLGESVKMFHTTYSDTGLFGMYATLNERHVAQIMDHMFYAFTRLFYQCTEDQLEGARNRVKAKLIANHSSTEQVSHKIGTQVLTLGRTVHLQEMIERVDAVDVNAIHAVAGRYFYDRDYALAAFGPTLEMMDYYWFRCRTYWRRY